MSPESKPYFYTIHLQGQLDERWLRQFEDLTIEQQPIHETVISGEMDQAALYGLLNRIRDLGLELISLQRTPLTPKLDLERKSK